jgi:hypothetical protein
MPLALTNDRQVKNFTSITQADHDLDSLLLVKFIRDFRRLAVFQTNQEQIARELQLVMKAVYE